MTWSFASGSSQWVPKPLLTAVQWDCCAKSAVDQLRFLRQAGCHVMLLPIHETKTYSGLGLLDMAHVVGQWELFIGMWLSGTSHPRPYVIQPGLWAIEVYIAGMGILDVFGFCDLDLTFIRWPSYTNLTRIAWTYTGCASTNTSYVKAFESYRLADKHT